MRKLLLFGCAAFLFACSNTDSADSAGGQSADTRTDNGEVNKEIVSKYLDAVHKGDTAGMSKYLADDFMAYGLGVKDTAGRFRTLDGVQKHWDVYKYGGKRYKRLEAVAVTTNADGGRGRQKGDWVYEWGDIETDYPDNPETGEKATTAEFTFHAAFRVENGKITSISTYLNHEDVMRQLGYKYLSPLDQEKVKNTGVKLR